MSNSQHSLIFSRVHDSEGERLKSIYEILRGDPTPAPPGFVISCQDGILLTALTNSTQFKKIYRAYDRIALVGAGVFADLRVLVKQAITSAHVLGDIELSAGDFRIFEQTVENLSYLIHARFRNLHQNDYFRCEMVIAQLNLEPEKDKIFQLSPSGDFNFAVGQLAIVPHPEKCLRLSPEQLQNLDQIGQRGRLTMRETLRRLQNLQASLEEHLSSLELEVATLSRELARQKRFNAVYKKLTPAEIADWLA